MPHIKILGRVLPEARLLTLPALDPVRYEDPDGFAVIFKIVIKSSCITMECSVSSIEEITMRRVIVRAQEIAAFAVNLAAFAQGWSLRVILDAWALEEIIYPIALSHPGTNEFCTAYGLRPTAYGLADGYPEMFAVAVSSFDLRFVLDDVIATLGTMNYSAIGCARAMETIRNSFSKDGASESEAWRRRREALRIDRQFLQFITDASQQPRHGRRGGGAGHDQSKITYRAWMVANRYFEFLKRGGTVPLPEAEFNVLMEGDEKR